MFNLLYYRVFMEYCVYFQEFSKVCHLSLASTRLLLVVQKINQPIGVTLLSHCVESQKVSYSNVGEGGVAVKCEIFPEHPVAKSIFYSQMAPPIRSNKPTMNNWPGQPGSRNTSHVSSFQHFIIFDNFDIEEYRPTKFN